MKQLWKDIWVSLCLGLVIPGLLLNLAVMGKGRADPAPEPAASGTPETKISLSVDYLRDDGTVIKMDMDEYLVGVLLAEMPAYFEEEALKAQAVVARTYARRTGQTGGKHGGSVCGDPGCCQGYESPQPEQDAAVLDRLRSAVAATSGQVLCYGGELIEATYFSCSGGKTEDAAAVWGQDYPYLRSVDSPGEETASHFSDSCWFSPEAFAEALGIDPAGEPETWLGTATYTAGGGVNTMEIGGKTFTGPELRSLLDLRSTALTIAVCDGQVQIITRGYGHRVGMSQYGADAMALGGSTYEDILSHYYQGTRLVRLSAEPGQE